MTGYREIVFSFSVGLIVIGTFHQLNQILTKERLLPVEEPTVLQGRGEDPALSLSWGLNEIRAPKAWATAQGREDIVVAVIDTGCDVHHPALIKNIWVNAGESGIDENGNPKATNGEDDDGNGFVDDFHGWNFVNSSPDVMDGHGHGTHIAGLIGGSNGVAPRVSLMILKYFEEDTSGEQNLKNTIRSIKYAVKMGAKIINYSGGGVIRSEEEEDVIRWAAKQGVLFVAAAGNEGLNSDFFHFYPANYDLPNIISVGASDRHGSLLSISNFGKSTVDIVAPGKNIYSSLPNGQYGYMTGTSQSTAFVTGLAALVMSRMNDPAPSEVIRRIIDSGRPLASLRGRTKRGSIVDAEQAVAPTSGEDPVTAGF